DAHDECMAVIDKNGYTHYIYPRSSADTTKITVQNWPPQVGDIWEARGQEYYIREYTLGGGGVVIEPFTVPHCADSAGWEDARLDDFKALNPVLVRRRGQ